jgi:hypothetical protein
MKTSLRYAKLLAGAVLALGPSTIMPTAFAGPGSGIGIWRNQPAAEKAEAAPRGTIEPRRACTDSRLVSVTATKWVRGQGRGMVIVDAGKTLVCNSCAASTVAAKTSDRNSNGPKASLPTKGLHDCSQNGCGGMAASSN